MANDFFKGNVKAYSENLNDSLLVGNAFDWTVDVALPSDTGGVFPNSSTVVKGKMADVSITPNSNLSIGSSIENSSGSSQVYRLTVYPNFNRFGGFKSIALDGDGTFYIANKGANTPIANNLDYDDLSNVPELKVLKEYDIVITIPNNGEVTGLIFVLQSSSADVSASINTSNVTGLTTRLTDIETKNTQQDGRLDTLESFSDTRKVFELYASNYNPTIDDTITVTARVYDVFARPVSSYRVTLWENGTEVSTQTTDENGEATWTITCDEWGLQTYILTDSLIMYNQNKTIQVNVTGFKQIQSYASGFYTLAVDGSKRMARLNVKIDNVNLATGVSYQQTGWIPSSYRPFGVMVSALNRGNSVMAYAGSSGEVAINNVSGSTQSGFSSNTTIYWTY